MIIDTNYINAGIKAIKEQKSDKISIRQLCRKYHLNSDYFYNREINEKTTLKTLKNLMECVKYCDENHFIPLEIYGYRNDIKVAYEHEIELNKAIIKLKKKNAKNKI